MNIETVKVLIRGAFLQYSPIVHSPFTAAFLKAWNEKEVEFMWYHDLKEIRKLGGTNSLNETFK